MLYTPARLQIVPLAVAALLGGLAATSFAAPLVKGDLATGQITLDANFSLPQSGPLTNALAGTPPPATIYESGNGADLYLYQNDASNNNAFFHTYGFADNLTYFGARASGAGSFYASTYARYSQTFTNTSLFDQIYNFAFNVSDGQLGITGSGAGFAELMLRVNITTGGNTTTLAQDYTKLTQGLTGGPSCTSNDIGSGLSGYMNCDSGNNIYGNSGPYSLSLGSIAAGESFTLDYDIIATVSGDLSVQSNGYGGYGENKFFNGCGNGVAARNTLATEVEVGGCAAPSFFPGTAIARSGDPFNGPQFGTAGPSDFITADFDVSAEVPEPGSLVLMGVALAGLATTRRKKKSEAL